MDQKTFDKVIDIVGFHTEGDGGYCDTGDDMDWYCRSECTDMALERLKEAFRKGEI